MMPLPGKGLRWKDILRRAAIVFAGLTGAAAAQEINSEARLGNVVIDCAELPPQVQRQLPPCHDYYEWIQSLSGDPSADRVAADPVVTLSNGMTFRCSELGDAAAQIPECRAEAGSSGGSASQAERP